ncbi:MAG TPA: DUF6285 domain-containing protein [Dehalococcoidia bacterium]
MQDRPTYDELLAAVEYFLDTEIVPNVPGARGFHSRVAANAIRIVRRELEREDEALAAEWAGLDALLGPAVVPIGRAQLRAALSDRNEAFCAQIRSGNGDEGGFAARVIAHVRRVVREKLRATDPELLSRSGDAGQ